MVSTLDGKAAIDWRTRGISTELDRQLFHHLRTQADAVMVGAGTVRAERYGMHHQDHRAAREARGRGAQARARSPWWCPGGSTSPPTCRS